MVMVLFVYFTIMLIAKELETVRMQSEFVSNVSHDLKTPLTSIRLFTEMLKDKKIRNRRKFRKYLNTIYNESERLSFLINNVLEFSNTGRKNKRLNKEPLNVVGVVKESVKVISPYAKQKGFKISIKPQKKLPEVLGNKISLMQAILNLLDNAIKYSLELKKILVKVSLVNDEVMIEVKDSGIGIEKQEQKKIFNKFYRANDKVVKEIKGIGLGLTIVKQIVNEHNGRLLLLSEKGRGSSFIISLRQRKPSS